MGFGKLIYYILYLPMICITGFVFVLGATSFLFNMLWEVATEFHKEMKGF